MTATARVTLYDLERAYRRRLVERALERAGGNVSLAALRLGVRRTYLYRLIDELGLRVGDHRGETSGSP